VSREDANRREVLINAGVDLLLEDGIHVLDSGITVERVCQYAQYSSPSTFSAEFSGKGAKRRFIEEMFLALVSGSSRASDHLGEEVGRAVAHANGEPIQVVREVAAWNYKLARDDPGDLRRMAAIVLGRKDKRVEAALIADYRRATQNGIDAYKSILEKWGATLRRPFTPMTLAVVLTALVEGLARRARAEPDIVPDSLFSDAVVGLIAGIVDVDQRDEHVDDAAAPISQAVRLTYSSVVNEELPSDSRKAILDAARAEFGRRGYLLPRFRILRTQLGCRCMY